MEKTQSKLHTAMCAVMQDIGAVGKDGKNTFDNYAYQRWEDIAGSIRRALIKHAVQMSVSVASPPNRDNYESAKGGRMTCSLVHLKITFRLGDETEENEWWGESADRSDKSIAKAITSGTKGFLLKRFLIPVTPEEGEHEDESPETGAPVDEKKWKTEVEKFNGYLADAGTDQDKLVKLKAWLEKRNTLIPNDQWRDCWEKIKLAQKAA